MESPSVVFNQAEVFKKIHDDIIAIAKYKICWYRWLKWTHVIGVNSVKVIAILLFAFGTLCPFLAKLQNDVIKLNKVDILNLGYLCLGAGSLILLFDKFFGLSTNLNRYNITLQKIEALRDNFIINWNCKKISLENQKEVSLVKDLLLLSKKFIEELNEIVEKEIAEWSTDFLGRIEELERKTNGQKPHKDLDKKANKISKKDSSQG